MVNGPQVHIIIVAAGSGTRFGADVPKQFLPLAGKAVVAHSIDTFRREFPDGKIIVVLSADGEERFAALGYADDNITTVRGGASRSESVAKALSALRCADTDVVMIHDGARPLISGALARRLYQAVATGSTRAVVPGYSPSDSLMAIGPDGSAVSVDRNNYRQVQTPQAFEASLIMEAYAKAGGAVASDDATLVGQMCGADVSIIDGDRDNIKITHPGDIELAEIYLRRRSGGCSR